MLLPKFALLLAIFACFLSRNAAFFTSENKTPTCPRSDGKENFQSCKDAVEECYANCHRGSGHGAGFCASFSSFLLPVVGFAVKQFTASNTLSLLSTTPFSSASYYCTSGAPYQACNYCGSKYHAQDVIRQQNASTADVRKLIVEAEEGRRRATEASEALSREMEKTRIRTTKKIRMFRFDRLFQDLDDLSFKFDLMRKAEEEKAAPSHKEGEDNGKRGSSSFAFDLFMESALYPGREGAAGVYRQMVEAMAGSPKSTRHLYHRRRKSVFEVDRSLCSRPSLEALLLSLMRAREMLLFALWNDGVDRENRKSVFETAKAKAAEDQSIIDEHIGKNCPNVAKAGSK